MRTIIPKEIDNLIPLFEPYIEHSHERGCCIRQDAPKDAATAFEKYIKWMRENASDRG